MLLLHILIFAVCIEIWIYNYLWFYIYSHFYYLLFHQAQNWSTMNKLAHYFMKIMCLHIWNLIYSRDVMVLYQLILDILTISVIICQHLFHEHFYFTITSHITSSNRRNDVLRFVSVCLIVKFFLLLGNLLKSKLTLLLIFYSLFFFFFLLCSAG